MKRFPSLLSGIIALTLFVPAMTYARYNPDIPWYRNFPTQQVEDSVDTLSSVPQEFFAIPVLFGISMNDFTSNFGVPRSGGRSHEGQDIVALTGTPIVSPTRAVVTHIRTGASAGHSVYTANPGGETFAYLHLDRYPTGLKAGDVLEVGDLVGYVGDTGNAKGGAAHLHFEVLRDEATDPYPRISREFTLTEKMQFTTRFLNQLPAAEATELANFLSTNFADEFALAERQGISLPTQVNSAQHAPTAAGSDIESLAQNLTIGSQGNAVVELQQGLIAILIGPKAMELEAVGATGYYGPLTQAALEEYRAFLAGSKPSLPIPSEPAPATESTPEPTPQSVSPSLSGMPQVDLKLGLTNNNVIWLQNYLIQAQSGPQATKLKEVGATGYFGPLTQSALAEYQAKQGISPAVGYYGPVTRAHIKNNN